MEEIISKISEKWFLMDPLLFSVFCSHNLVLNRKLSCPFRTGKKRIEYNPDALKDFSETQIEKYLKAEIFRILLKHPYQRQPSFPNHEVLTLASNITIADSCDVDVVLEGVKEFRFPPNLCFEEYYARLLEKLPEGGVRTGGSPSDGEASGGDNKLSDTSALWEEDQDMELQINGIIEDTIASDSWGSVSGKLQGLIKASLVVDMDYRKMLSIFKTSIISSKRRLTRMRPSRRFGFLQMGSRYELATNILIAVDVSGSVTDKSLQKFFSIINRFFKYGVEKLDVIQFDWELKGETMEMKKAMSSIKIMGRGGTSFQPPVDYYCQHPEYDGLVIFTDGYAEIPVFNTKRVIDVLWVLTSKSEYEEHKGWIKNLRRNRAMWIPKLR